MDDFLAHISEDGLRNQTVTEHLRGTAMLAAGFGSAFGAEKQAEFAALFHDIGKFSREFQRRIRGNGGRVDHSTAGARELWTLRQLDAAFAVAGHHGGLPDGGNPQNGPDEPTLCGRLQRELADYSAWSKEIEPLPPVPPARNFGGNKFAEAFYIRMLYSCLVDADYQDTENFMKNSSELRGGFSSLAELLEKVRVQSNLWLSAQSGKEIDGIRNKILRSCIDSGKNSKTGIFTLTVPTGGGKTFASMAFALEHAVKNDLNRVIYVVPYTSIIEQTVDVFRKLFGEENVLAHYAGADYYRENIEDLTPTQYRHLLSSENWDAPIIVTTAVQFFESLYSNRPGKCRKLHNIAKSVLIFDEAQTLPVPYLRPCVAAMAQLAKDYRASMVLCTATQPALDKLFYSFAPDMTIREICKTDIDLNTALKRTSLKSMKFSDQTHLSQILAEHTQVLCVVNRRKTAIELYSSLPKDGSYCLTTFLAPCHRRKKLEEIRERLRNNMPCRVVSTSLVEAGVDVDFPAAFREEAGLDSVLQTAGRCNREGKRPADKSDVIIFSIDGTAPPRGIAANRDVLNQTRLKYHDALDSPEAIRFYFEQLLYVKGSAALDKHGIVDGFTNAMNGSIFPFRQAAESFRLIDNLEKVIYIPISEGAKLCERLMRGEVSKTLYRQLGEYAVSVYPDHYQELYTAGALTSLENGSAVLINADYYSGETGLKIDADSGAALIW